MNFLEKYKQDIFGQISCFDRMIFRGYLTSFFQSSGIYYYLSQSNVLLKNFKEFVLKTSKQLKDHIENLAATNAVPLIYLNSPQSSKEEIVKEVLMESPDQEGLSAIIKVIELCQSVEVRGNKLSKKLEVVNSWRKVHGNFKGEVITDRKRFSQGFRVKHRLAKNSRKMYDKDNVLRIETTINNPKVFKIFKTVIRKGQQTKAWVPMGKSVSNLYRYAQVSMTANEKYLTGLCAIDIRDNPGKKVEKLSNRVITKTKTGSKISTGGFNLLKEETCLLFEAINDSRFCLNNFRNRDLRELLIEKGIIKLKEKTKKSLKKLSNKITRLLSKLRAHKLIAKIPRSFCSRVTKSGMELITRILRIRKVEILALG